MSPDGDSLQQTHSHKSESRLMLRDLCSFIITFVNFKQELINVTFYVCLGGGEVWGR